MVIARFKANLLSVLQVEDFLTKFAKDICAVEPKQLFVLRNAHLFHNVGG